MKKVDLESDYLDEVKTSKMNVKRGSFKLTSKKHSIRPKMKRSLKRQLKQDLRNEVEEATMEKEVDDFGCGYYLSEELINNF